MAQLRTLNEFGRESVVFALEPARECVAHCTYCFAALNSAAQLAGKDKNLEDDGSFESLVEKTFSSSYNETDFRQWGLRNSLVLGYANTVEPFQDINQAKGILKTCDTHSIPLFIQTKGINFNEVFSHLKPFHDNCSLFLSFPTDNDKAIKRFEPGTPFSAERYALIEKAVNSGFHVVHALAPYHEDWCDDPLAFVERTHKLGIKSVFFDRLHLNKRQREVISGKTPTKSPIVRDKHLLPLASVTESEYWPEKALAHYQEIWEYCRENNIRIFSSSFLPTAYGFVNSVPAINAPSAFSRATHWPYSDGNAFLRIMDDFYDEEKGIIISSRDMNDSLLVKWNDFLYFMESTLIDGFIDQEFSWSSMRTIIEVNKLSARWKEYLGKQSTIRDYFKAFWNSPSRGSFAWRHPWAKIAKKPSGEYWQDGDGNLIMLFDPDFVQPGKERVVEDLDVFRSYELKEGDENA